MKNKLGEIRQSEIDSEKNILPVGIDSEIKKAFGRHRQLYQGHWYRGTKRLSGNLPYQIVEAMAIELLARHSLYKSNGIRISHSKLEETIVEANENQQNAFMAIYELVGKKNNILKDTWNESRKILNDYADNLWQKRNTFGEQMAKRAKKVFPGTIYLNNGRYYWLPKHGEKVIPLIPEKARNKIPGSLFKNDPGGYFWWIPHLKFRRRMVSDGEKIATKDLKTAKKLQRQEWEKIQQYEPRLAAKLKSMRRWGVATRHKPTAVKIAKRFWARMQDNDPAAVERIMSDKRPEKTKPDIDKVWPSWAEQKARLKLKENKSYMPVVYPGQAIRDEWKYGLHVPEKLEAIVGKIKKVDWMVDNAMLVFDDNSPMAPREIAIQSRGRDWMEEQYKDNKKCVIRGSASIDKDLRKIRFTVYNPGYTSARTLAEEVYHIVFEIVRQINPQTFGVIQAWYEKKTGQGGDLTLDIAEVFSQAMAQEEIGYRSNLPRAVVKYARRVISNKNDVKPNVMAKVRARLSGSAIFKDTRDRTVHRSIKA